MNTQATTPKFSSYADVIKAVEAAQSKDALNELADLVDDEFTSERLALTDENWADLACRVLLRHDHIQNQPVAAPAPAESADSPSSIIATYVSVWDGSVNLETPCVIDLATGLLSRRWSIPTAWRAAIWSSCAWPMARSSKSPLAKA